MIVSKPRIWNHHGVTMSLWCCRNLEIYVKAHFKELHFLQNFRTNSPETWLWHCVRLLPWNVMARTFAWRKIATQSRTRSSELLFWIETPFQEWVEHSLHRPDHRWGTIYIHNWRWSSFDSTCFQQRGRAWVAWGMGKSGWSTYKCRSEVVAWEVKCCRASS